ncbi:uncharacterized protein BCR38DRAFT_112332 [Pseudomassariella vexata]|uniref:Uncharacterized protein n=1 Tax=Pseudomassariella vexata TaxID=1141098 RepID=A0A1Y2DDZ1_9PEZI|nr:uncharacterized protein BCR38DRAFT_112332 [Pseudomassariella vexata]ORY56895.1 hypothetical protein BCR38DRAFT_112332 [Pseudomassariella vexata]
MRPRGLIFGAVIPLVVCAADSQQVQVPIVINEEVPPIASHPLWVTANNTMVAATTPTKPSAVNATITPTPPAIAMAAADLPSPALDKSLFSLIVFGVAGLCLL